jgi:hypothetical protein
MTGKCSSVLIKKFAAECNQYAASFMEKVMLPMPPSIKKQTVRDAASVGTPPRQGTRGADLGCSPSSRTPWEPYLPYPKPEGLANP